MPYGKVEFDTTDTGCIITTSHKLNHDGYFRKWNPIKKKLEMYHRTVWEEENGEILEGYEIDHLCKNRACCNVAHLQLLSNREHTIKDNTGRNSLRKTKAYRYWRGFKPTGTRLAEIFNVSFSTGCKWIREWSNY